MNPAIAPGHVAHIKKLVSEGFYDGIVFHRVIDGFMAQTGCPKGPARADRNIPTSRPSSTTSRTCAAPCRWPARRARIRPIRSSSSASATPASSTGKYTVWGKVISGMENVDKIKRGEPVRDPDKIVKASLS